MSKQARKILSFWILAILFTAASLNIKDGTAILSLGIILAIGVGISIWDLSRHELIKLLFITGILLPGITIPLFLENGFFLPGDRLRVSFLFSLPIGLVYILKADKRGKKFPFLLLVGTFLYHVISGNILSFYQAWIEFLYFSIVVVLVFSRFRLDSLVSRDTFWVLLGFFLIDLLVTISGAVEWTVSYRSGLQGLFFAHELAFASFLLFVSILGRIFLGRKIFYLVLFLPILYFLYKSNIKSGFLILFAIPWFEIQGKRSKLGFGLGLAAALLIFVNIGSFPSLAS